MTKYCDVFKLFLTSCGSIPKIPRLHLSPIEPNYTNHLRVTGKHIDRLVRELGPGTLDVQNETLDGTVDGNGENG